MDRVGLAGELRGEGLQAAEAEPVGLEKARLVGPGTREEPGEYREGAIEEMEVLFSERPNEGLLLLLRC